MNVELFVWQVVNYLNNNTVNNDCVGFLQTHAASLEVLSFINFFGVSTQTINISIYLCI